MDITPLIPGGRQVIEGYSPSGFRVSGALYAGSVLVFVDRTELWPVSLGAATLDRFAPVVARGDVEILLLGCGTVTVACKACIWPIVPVEKKGTIETVPS